MSKIKRYNKNIEEIIKTKECPFPIDVIPNNMGINLCAVESISYSKINDELVDLTIHFIPSFKEAE